MKSILCVLAFWGPWVYCARGMLMFHSIVRRYGAFWRTACSLTCARQSGCAQLASRVHRRRLPWSVLCSAREPRPWSCVSLCLVSPLGAWLVVPQPGRRCVRLGDSVSLATECAPSVLLETRSRQQAPKVPRIAPRARQAVTAPLVGTHVWMPRGPCGTTRAVWRWRTGAISPWAVGPPRCRGSGPLPAVGEAGLVQCGLHDA
jgi:hypothetical protein